MNYIQDTQVIDTIVIGAGIAGLYYIYKFKPSNYIILDKDNRVGGRIYNKEWYGEQISLGGGIVKHNNINTLNLLNELNLDTTDFISSYHFIDFHGKSPNEKLFHQHNKIIIKYLRKIYNKNKNEIHRMKLSFSEFLSKYINYEIVKIIKNTLLYKTYMNADVNYTLQDDTILELLRTDDFKLKAIKNGGYTLLLHKLLEFIDNSKIYLNSPVIKISKHNNNFSVLVNDKYFYSNKIVLATDKKSNILFDLTANITNNIINTYNLVDGAEYIRIYTFHKNGHGLTNSVFTHNLPGKIIVMNKNILMACYTEGYNAIKLKHLLEKNTKEDQIDIVYNLLLNSNVIIKKPDDITYKFWNIGTHFLLPNTNYNQIRTNIKELSTHNIFLIGELFASSHGWVDGALETVNKLYSDIK